MAQLIGWTEQDDQVVRYARALAMDAVQKVGNGHPGTAMSLAPVAYNLFQRHMVHDPADPHWVATSSYCKNAAIDLLPEPPSLEAALSTLIRSMLVQLKTLQFPR